MQARLVAEKELAATDGALANRVGDQWFFQLGVLIPEIDILLVRVRDRLWLALL